MKTELKGIKRNTPSGLSQDGELEEIINLRYRDGAWRPIPERTAILSNLVYKDIYIHSNSGFKHFIGLKTDGTFEYFKKQVGSDYIDITPKQVIAVLQGSPTFTQIGNVININDSQGIKHAIWYNNGYVLIDSNFDGVQTSDYIGICRTGLKVSGKEIESGKRKVNMYYSDELYHGGYLDQDDTNETKINIKRIADGLITKAKALEQEDGNISGFFLACTAIELYDGNYILHSQPTLCGQPFDADTRIEDVLSHVDGSLVDEDAVVTDGIGLFYKEDGKVVPQGYTLNSTKKRYEGGSNTFYAGDDVLANVVEKNQPNMYVQLPVPNPTLSSEKMYVTISSNELKYKIHNNISANLSTLIKSISVFITPFVDFYKTPEDSIELISNYVYFGIYGGLQNRCYNMSRAKKTNAEILTELEGLKTFYKVHEIPFESITAGDWQPIDLKDKLGDLLYTQETLTYDNFSHHQILPKCQFNYNSKLHLLNYNTLLSRGFPLPYFYASQGVGQFQPTSQTNLIDRGYIQAKIKTGSGVSIVSREFTAEELLSCDISPIISYPDARATEITLYRGYGNTLRQAQIKNLMSVSNEYKSIELMASIEATINIVCVVRCECETIDPEEPIVYITKPYTLPLGETSIVISVEDDPDFNNMNILSAVIPSWITQNDGVDTYYASNFEGSEITSDRVIEGSAVVDTAVKKTFQLKASTSQNFAYYINPELKPIVLDSADVETVFPLEQNRELIYSNSLKVSEVNNPFIFPVENTYQIGNGEGLAMATNTIALSTGQFGEFPVYVFCTDGIYGLFIGGAEVNYASSRPISREVCNNPNSVKAIDSGVIFTTEKGVMLLVGSQVKELSETLRGQYFNVDNTDLFKKALTNNKLVQLYSERTNETLLNFLDKCIVGYNYIYSEVWFTNPDYTYSYVFSKGLWYKVKQTGTKYINDYPKQYVLNSGSLIDISSETGTSQAVNFLTRPLKLGDNNFKQLLTAIIRGELLTANKMKLEDEELVLDYKRYAGLYIFGSYDNKRWVFLGGVEKNGELNNLGARVERTDCKFYRIGFVGNITNESTIEYIELEGKQSILGKRIR